MHPTLERFAKRLAHVTKATTSKGLLAAARRNITPAPELPLRHAVFRKPRNNEAASRTARELCEGANPRKKNLYTGQAVISAKPLVESWETINYKGKFKGYRGSSVTANYGSFSEISTARRCMRLVVAGVASRLYIAPAGMQWEHDANGLLLRRLSDRMDYHPTDADPASPSWVAVCRRGMEENWKSRREFSAKLKNEAAFVRRSGSVRVNLLDSRRAGNCVAGTLAWAERALKVDRQQLLDAPWLVTYPAKLLRRKAASFGDPARVEAAILAAEARECMVCI